MEDSNILISEFIGYKVSSDRWNINGLVLTTALLQQFETSWDWLMPVIEKIETVDGGIVIGKTTCSLIYGDGLTQTINKNIKGDKLEVIYSLVIDFIKWYNENKK